VNHKVNDQIRDKLTNSSTVRTVNQTSKLKFSQNIEVEVLQFGKIEVIFFEDLSETSTSTLKGYTDTSSCVGV
jgi:hypothetical protein